VLVAVASRHRGEARRLRIHHGLSENRAPFWKKEETPEGERWVTRAPATTRRRRAGPSDDSGSTLIHFSAARPG